MTTTIDPPVIFENRSKWGKLVDIDTIKSIHVPQIGPDTWRPMPHDTLVEMIEQAFDRHGFTVSDPVHYVGAATQKAQIKDQGEWGKFLTMYALDHPLLPTVDGFSWESAWFNSYDMTKAIQFAIGGRVEWCSNGQMWAGEGGVTYKRKHTSKIDEGRQGLFEPIFDIIDNAMEHVIPAAKDKARLIDKYMNTDCSDDSARFIIMEAAKEKVIGAAATMRVLKHWEEPEHEEFSDRTVWSLHNAFTSNDRGNSLLTQANRMRKLESIVDDYFYRGSDTASVDGSSDPSMNLILPQSAADF